jgi:tetratricopeptide (TPR) repeat protein
MIEDLAERADDEGLKRLLSYLAADPLNANLRADAAERALDSDMPDLARELLGSDPETLGDRGLGLLGLAQMLSRNFGEAAKCFEMLASRGVSDPAVRFNLAWSLSAERKPAAALQQLTPEVTQTLPQAATLEVRLLHEQGEFERAAEVARNHLERFPEDARLAAAVSVLALDVEDVDLARECAEKAGDQPEALATLGTLALGEQKVGEAVRLFDKAIAANGNVPRAWIGRGLARLVEQDSDAASDIDHGAELFGDHIGSWIAAGWAYLIVGRLGEARQRFERALAIDDNFGESHGSLAVVDVLDGDEGGAQKRIAIALRLDPQSFSARFARTLLIERSGDVQAARKLLAKILETPVNDRGDSAAVALTRLGLG